ncbi:MAG: hypothetical protein ABMA13_18970 [Chthoniobacteraceae bacterium]
MQTIDMVAYLNVSVTVVFRNDSDSAFSLTASSGGRQASIGMVAARSGERNYSATLSFEIGRLTLWRRLADARWPDGVLTSVWAPIGNSGEYEGRQILGFGPQPKSAEDNAIKSLFSGLDNTPAAKAPVMITATGMGGKDAGRVLPYELK